jgi:hypothetical protein
MVVFDRWWWWFDGWLWWFDGVGWWPFVVVVVVSVPYT